MDPLALLIYGQLVLLGFLLALPWAPFRAYALRAFYGPYKVFLLSFWGIFFAFVYDCFTTCLRLFYGFYMALKDSQGTNSLKGPLRAL